MSMLITNNFAISLQNVDQNVYKLHVNFPLEGSSYEKTFTFKKGKVEDDTTILDVFTKNVTAGENFPKGVIPNSDLKMAKAVKELVGESTHPKLYCLDVKKQESHYLPSEEETTNSSCEETVCKIISSGNKCTSKSAKKVLKNSPKYDFVFCEGTLKNDLLKSGVFDQHQVTYLNDNIEELCQLTEFFMHAIKLGQTVEGFPIDANKYIHSVSGENFNPFKKSVVYFPSGYEVAYASNGVLHKAYQQVYNIDISSHIKNGFSFTSWTVEEKS